MAAKQATASATVAKKVEGPHRGGSAQGAGQGLHERGAARVLQAAPASSCATSSCRTPTTPASICARTRSTTDPSDRATLEEEYTLELRTRDRERKLLKKVEKSIKLIDDGSYGYCEETGEPIGIPRLLARPTATLSLEAQERRERVQKLYGD